MGSMRKTDTIKKAISRARKSNDGALPIPKTWDEMTIPANYAVTARGGPFLALEETTDLSQKIIVFCSQEQKNAMNTAQYWIADGTFDVVSKTLFAQLFIITSMTPTGITVQLSSRSCQTRRQAAISVFFNFLKMKVSVPRV